MKAILLFTIGLIMPYAAYGQLFEKADETIIPLSEASFSGFYLGAAFVDVDHDGDEDLSISGSNSLFINNGDGTFSSLLTRSLFSTGNAGSVSWADLDGDLYPECLVGSFNDAYVLKNEEGKSFKRVELGSSTPTGNWSSSFGDWNMDGKMDAVLAVAFGFGPLNNTPSRLFQSIEDLKFIEIENQGFTENTEAYTVANWFDIDDDGDQDLLFASGPASVLKRDFIYINNFIPDGVPGFTLATKDQVAFTDVLQNGQCYNVVDTDLDGEREVLLTNWTNVPNRYYKLQNGTYREVLTQLSGSRADGYLANSWGDLDNDGYEDVILTSSISNSSKTGPFKNLGNDQFEKMSFNFKNFDFENRDQMAGLTIGDYDDDGDLDFFVTAGSASGIKTALFTNTIENDNHWIKIRLTGKRPNRSAVGARVYAHIDFSDDESKWMSREISAQNSWAGHNAYTIHFGMGEDEIVDSLKVVWPDGSEEILTDIPVDRRIELRQITSSNNPDVVARPLSIYPTFSKDIITIKLDSGNIEKGTSIEIIDTTGRLFKRVSAEKGTDVQVPTSHLPVGTYRVIIRMNQAIYTGLFFKV